MKGNVKTVVEGILIVGGLVLMGCYPTAWL